MGWENKPTSARLPEAPAPFFPRLQRGADGVGSRRGPQWGPGSRPPAASPSSRASSGCSPRRTPARRWLTAPCGAAGERARGRAGPGRGRSCGAAAEARDARTGGVPVTLARARTRTRTRAHPPAFPHAADVPFLNLRNVFLGASEQASARGVGGAGARLVPGRSRPLPAGPAPARAPPRRGSVPPRPGARGRAQLTQPPAHGTYLARAPLGFGEGRDPNTQTRFLKSLVALMGWAGEETGRVGRPSAPLLTKERAGPRRGRQSCRTVGTAKASQPVAASPHRGLSRSGLRSGADWPGLCRPLHSHSSIHPSVGPWAVMQRRPGQARALPRENPARQRSAAGVAAADTRCTRERILLSRCPKTQHTQTALGARHIVGVQLFVE